MKKTIGRITVLLLCLIMLCNFAACGGKSADNNDNGGDSGDGDTPQPPVTDYYTAVAKDQYGNAIEGVWLEICYYDNIGPSASYTTKTVANSRTQTDAQGVAAFESFVPEEGIEYTVRPSSVGSTAAFPPEYTAPEDAAHFDGKTATLVFRYLPDRFIAANLLYLDYKRTYNPSGTPTETNTPLEIELKKDVDKYFCFMPYSAPTLVTDKDVNPATGKPWGAEGAATENARLINAATVAATGTYTVSFTPISGTRITLTHYNGSASNMPQDPETGKPNSVAESTTAANHSITMNRHRRVVNGDVIFGISADKDCTVTVAVNRDGDADEPEENFYTMTPAEIIAEEKWTEGALSGTDSPVLAPVDGKTQYVKGADDYYHVGEANGPLLYAQLKNSLERVSEYAIADMRKAVLSEQAGEVRGDAAFIFTSVNDGMTVYNTYDYNAFIDAYVAKANADGLYPVNEELKTFLGFIGQQAWAALSTPTELQWVLPCQYYTSQLGTANNPIPLGLGRNSLNLSDYGLETGATLQFTAAETSAYCIETDKGILNCADDSAKVVNSSLYVTLKAGEHVKLTVNGSAEMKITVDKLTDSLYADASEGNSVSNAVKLDKADFYTYIVDTAACADGVYVKFTSPTAGKYSFGLSKDATLAYDGNIYTQSSPLTVNATAAGTEYDFVLSASGAEKDGAYWLHIFKVNEMDLGSTENIRLNKRGDATYRFTSAETAVYKLTVIDPNGIVNAETGRATIVMSGNFYQTFYVNAGESVDITFYNTDFSTAATFTATVEKVTTLGTGEENAVLIPASSTALKFTFAGNSAKYTIKISAPKDFTSTLPDLGELTVTVGGESVTFTASAIEYTAEVTINSGDEITIKTSRNIYIAIVAED